MDRQSEGGNNGIFILLIYLINRKLCFLDDIENCIFGCCCCRLDQSMKTYYIYHNESQQAEQKLEKAEKEKTRIEQESKKGVQSRRFKNFEKQYGKVRVNSSNLQQDFVFFLLQSAFSKMCIQKEERIGPNAYRYLFLIEKNFSNSTSFYHRKLEADYFLYFSSALLFSYSVMCFCRCSLDIVTVLKYLLLF